MRQRSHGFTLVEVLVALSIMAIMAAMAWRGIDALVKSRDGAQGQLERVLRLNTVLAQWQADFAALQSSHADMPPFYFDSTQIALTRTTPDGLQVVVWRLHQGQLWRWASPATTTREGLRDAAQAGRQRLGRSGAELMALSGVQSWQLYCFWGNAWSNCLSSGDAAQDSGPTRPAVMQTAPQGLRLVLEFSPESGWPGPVMRQIEVLAP